MFMVPHYTKPPSAHFRSRAHPGLKCLCNRRPCTRAWMLYQCAAIRCVFKSKWQTRILKLNDIFTNLWYCCGLLCTQGFKLRASRGFSRFSESSPVSAESSLTVGNTAYPATFYFMPSHPHLWDNWGNYDCVHWKMNKRRLLSFATPI